MRDVLIAEEYWVMEEFREGITQMSNTYMHVLYIWAFVLKEACLFNIKVEEYFENSCNNG